MGKENAATVNYILKYKKKKISQHSFEAWSILIGQYRKKTNLLYVSSDIEEFGSKFK